MRRENGEQVSYDPRRLHGVTLYREIERAFSQGDRVKFTAPNREQHIANRDLGTIEKIGESGKLQVLLDSGREVAFNIKENPHLDYGYAVTSRSSQGQTADRVLVHVDTEQAGDVWRMWRYRADVMTRKSTRTTRTILPSNCRATCHTDPQSNRAVSPHPQTEDRAAIRAGTSTGTRTASGSQHQQIDPDFLRSRRSLRGLPTVTLDRGFASGFLLSHERHGPLCAQLATGR